MLNFFLKNNQENNTDADFTQQYLEQNQQNSNIYFHQAQKERVQKKQRSSLKEKMMRRFFLLLSSGIAMATFVVIFSLFQFSHNSITYTFDSASFKNIISGSEALADFRFQTALTAFKQAEKKGIIEKRPFDLSALSLSATRYFSSSTETTPDISKTFSNTATVYSQAYQDFLKLTPESFFTSNKKESAGMIIAQAYKELQEAQEMLKNITEPSLWQEMTAEEKYNIDTAFADIPSMQESQNNIIPLIDFLARLFDPTQSRKILILLQNQNIPRASGGYIDAVGIMNISEGAITSLSFDDIHNLDGQLLAKIIPPVQLQNNTTSWGMRDVNWFLDFPTLAKKAGLFYKKSGGEEIDGVLALDEELITDLFRTAGAISTSHAEVNADNILSLLRTHTPKQNEKIIPISSLNEAIPLLFKKLSLLSESDIASLFHMYADALSRKNMMVWFRDSSLQKIISYKGWDGKILNTDNSNYVAFLAYDIDETILPYPLSQDILVQTNITENGDIINTVAVQLQRHGDDASQSGDDSQYYTKLYVPKGSQFIASLGGSEQVIVPQIDYAGEHFMPDEDVYASEAVLQHDHANKIDIFEESGKTVFGTYITPGTKGTKLLYHYKLPFTLAQIQDDFISIFQKQPGSHGVFQFSALIPDGKEIVSSDEHPFSGEFSGAFARDLIFSAKIK